MLKEGEYAQLLASSKHSAELRRLYITTSGPPKRPKLLLMPEFP